MSSTYHEPSQELPPEVRDTHRALASLIEELEAIDWYNQRASLTTDPELKEIVQHNRDEEIEHAAMALEWLRRRIPKFDEELKTYLFSSGPITEIEEALAKEPAENDAPAPGSLGIGSLRKES
ncbi:MAG: ferritin [Candidatus Glassbacteria bacterium]|nr:ferritin [Candidatus Glassbacteria bacterium]